MKSSFLISALIFPFFLALSQEKIKDTIKTNQLQEVVVTGQFEPQSIKKSVFNVRVITKNDIQKLAANNLADVLNQYLNITVSPNSGTGRSTVSMFGLNGNYFKIFVDIVPIVSDSGLGNNVDLSQINLDDIEQIEIIEGSMGVTHGANAVSGILNIITKKTLKNKWEIGTTVQEETVGEEYALFNKGRHIQSLKVSKATGKNWFTSMGFNRNDFAGYLDDRKGKDYAETDLKRGFTWLPKLQLLTNGMLSYKKDNFRAFYKFDYLNENIDYYNPSVIVVANPPFEENKFAKDKRFLTERFFHHWNATGKLFQLNYNTSLSFQKQTRSVENFDYDFNSKNESNNAISKSQATQVLFATGTLSNFFKNKKADLQLGYEATNNLGFALLDGENQTLVPFEKRFENYDFFASSEYNATPKLSIRTGVRVSFQSQFENQYASSLGLRYLVKNGIELRTSFGKSFRVPVFEELYSKIKFSGHQFYGNENLIPETSTSYDFSIKKTSSYKSGLKLANQFSVAFLNVNNRIDMAFVGFETGTTDPVYQYININSYKMWNLSSNNHLEFKNWTANTGVSLVGISQVIDNGTAISDDKFLYNLQLNANLSYHLLKYNTQFSVYYKFNGKQQQFVSAVENNENVFKLSEIESYHFLDASIKKSFFKNQFDVTLGARNILDVTRIQQGLSSGNVHDSSTTILLGYGRSYFIKLTYNLNF